MKKNTAERTEMPALVQALMGLLAAHAGLYRQGRVQRRVVSLVIGELFAFGRRTVTQGLLALGLWECDWSAWYRLFSCGRFDEAGSGAVLLCESLAHVPEEQPYVVGTDGVRIPRSSKTLAGTSWLPALGTAFFKRGLQRAQRFVHGAWLTPLEGGYSRAIPLRFVPAFPAKAVAAEAGVGKAVTKVAACREWEAGLQFVRWVRTQLDQAGRGQQMLLWLADGSYDVLDLWRQLPERCILVVRTARNRALFALPASKTAQAGQVGRPPSYGDQALSPGNWLRQRKGWTQLDVLVRGTIRRMRYRVEGPFVRADLPGRVLFLIIIGGSTRQVGKRHPKRKQVQPCFYLVNAIPAPSTPGLAENLAENLVGNGDVTWQLPLPIPILLAWLWQRWELEVAHREMKSELGVGEIQCWNPRAAVLSVQWSVWCYALLLFAGYRTWGICHQPLPTPRWQQHVRRWSISTLLRAFRAAFWHSPQFRTAWSPSTDNWADIDAWINVSANAATFSTRL